MMNIIQEYTNHLEEIIENSFNYIYLHDKRGNILDVNNVIVKNLGYSKKEILKMKVSDFLHEEVTSKVSDEIKKTLETGVVNKPKIYKVKKKDDSFVYIEGSAIPLKKEGKFHAILGIGHDITAYIEVEQKLKESEEKYYHLFNQSPLNISLFDIKGNLIETNGTIRGKLAEYAKLNFKGQNFIEIASHFANSKEIIQLFIKRFKDLREGKTLDPIEFFILTKKGRKIWLRWQSAKVEINDQIFIQVIIQDITQQKEAEEEIKESEEKFRTLFEKANDGILLTAIETEKILTGNKKISEMLGYSIEELKSLRFKDLHPKESLHYIDRLFSKDQYDGSSIGKDIPIKRKDGSIFYCNVNSSQIELSSKSYFMGIFRDITERKIAEQKLQESEEKFRNIAEQSFMGIIIIQNGEIKYMNKALSKISGYSIEEMMNWKRKELLKIIYIEDLETLKKRLLSNIERTMGSYSINTFRIINKNGEIRWLEDYTSKIIYQGSPANLISIVDITDKKEAEQLIIEENKRLLELHDLRKDIITRVSHELKTPMTSIYGAHQILIKLYMDEIGEEAQKYIEIGYRGSLRMKQLIDNLLDVSRLDAKKIDLNFQKENLINLLIDSVKDMNYLAANRQLKLKLDLPNETYIEIDRLRFRQVLSNIISNAIKNTPKGGEILIILVEKPEHVDIQVKDNGVGITEKEKEKLFEKFGKIERYGMDLGVDIEGSGLGLYISKEIVELHGGQILVESEGRYKGSTFTIRLFKKQIYEF